jgi:pyruvate ferredoxin oxidoreductase alpha subunit
VESEFSALSGCVGASAAGSRTYSATTSQGLALMFEVCFNAAGMRLPIVMTIANRAMGAPLSIWNDQQDSISLRDAGWLQYYAEDNQEATDLHFITYKVAEDHNVLLPAMVCFDGFILTHTYEPVDMPSQEEIDAFLPPFKPYNLLDAKKPMSLGMYATPEYYMEFRYENDEAMKRAKQAFARAGKEFGETFGRDYSGLVEGYRLEDADTAIVAMGSICGTVKDAIDEMRADGMKVGLLKIRSFRPFPSAEIKKALSGVSKVAVLDKNISLGAKGAVALEVKDALYGSGIPVLDYIVALGGRDIRKKDIAQIVDLAEKGIGDMFYGLRTEVL